MAAREGSSGKKVNSAIIRTVGGQGQGVELTKHRPKIVVLLRDGGQVRWCGSGLEFWRPRRLSGPQALGKAVCTPRRDSTRSPIDLRVVRLEPGVTQDYRGEGTGNHQK
jgi:hypothetical protein